MIYPVPHDSLYLKALCMNSRLVPEVWPSVVGLAPDETIVERGGPFPPIPPLDIVLSTGLADITAGSGLLEWKTSE